MSWLKEGKGIQTKTEEKDIPKGLWYKTLLGRLSKHRNGLEFYVSPEDDYHVYIGSKEYFEFI